MVGTALVVGGSSDIGRATAAVLAQDGHEVVLWGRNRERLTRARDAVVSSGGVAHAVPVDVTVRAELATAARDLAGELRVVVWAAGVFDWADADVADARVWERLLDVNLTSAALTTRLLLPRLLDSAPSTLVYIGSGAARAAFAHNAAYVASKHGLAGLAQAVWLDVRDRGVKVSLVSPGLVAAGAGLASPAGMTHPELLLAAEDVAAAVRFVVGYSNRGCPTEIRLEPHHSG
ncbi:MAG TPA: SDR family oxidoreductase [Nocardioidaceae bacterium]|nr:SDR family oxidoreductase [Nocardioidaceae bacterium]